MQRKWYVRLWIAFIKVLYWEQARKWRVGVFDATEWVSAQFAQTIGDADSVTRLRLGAFEAFLQQAIYDEVVLGFGSSVISRDAPKKPAQLLVRAATAAGFSAATAQLLPEETLSIFNGTFSHRSNKNDTEPVTAYV